MSDPGGFAAITQPVLVERPVETAPVVEAAATEDAMDFAEPVIIRSEDIQDQAAHAHATPEVEAHVAAEPETAPAVEPSQDVVVEVEVEEVTSDGVHTISTTTRTDRKPFAGGWPLRLVKTLPDTNPPRAILGLPDGEEIVVSPGRMIPSHQLVVMAIGPHSAELARIVPDGDHASVNTISLQTQY